MNTLHSYLAYYLLAINAVAFIVYGIDKYKAKKAKWRIPEVTLLLLAVVGGSVGAWMGMTKYMSIKKNGIYWKGIKRRIGRFFEKVHECILIFTDWLG